MSEAVLIFDVESRISGKQQCPCCFIIIYNWIDYLVRNKYITECFGNMPVEGSNMTHTVSLPLTTTYSCKNMCGPTGRCSITGEQCMADIDCVGCQPYSPPLSKEGGSISGDDDAGKLTFGMTPQYSSLTAGYGTKEKIITDNETKRICS